VSVKGSKFGPNEAVAITLLGKVVGQTTSSASGSIPATKVTVPASAGFGPTALVATGATSGATAAAGIDVTNNWSQLGGGPGHTGFEANDPVIQNTVSPGQNILLVPAWHFSASAALTSPTIVHQVAYVGDQHGTLHALRARDGTQLWTWSTPTGAAITGEPAVDAAAGLAFVGAANGTLYAVVTSGPSAGKLAWSAHVGGGNVQSPVFNGTTVYASAGGEVAALSEATGSSVWSAPVTGGGSAAPALDTAGHVLVVPTTSGITALNAAAGTSLWSFALPGPTSPMLAAGTVYVGSSNDDVYAVSESTGKQIWSRKTGGAIQDSGALSETHGAVTGLYISSADGNLYFLDPATGAVLVRLSLGASASGLAFAGNIVLAAAGGLAEGVRTFPELVWSYGLSDGNLLPPAVVNGTFFVAGQQGTLWAFTPYGAPPP
jgi:outer membrane protein assembly factor BamB